MPSPTRGSNRATGCERKSGSEKVARTPTIQGAPKPLARGARIVHGGKKSVSQKWVKCMEKKAESDAKTNLQIADIVQAENKVRAAHREVVKQVQSMLDSMEGRSCRAEDGTEIVSRINHLAKDVGVRLVGNGKTADLRWRREAFEAREVVQRRGTVALSPLFPHLEARAMWSDREDIKARGGRDGGNKSGTGRS